MAKIVLNNSHARLINYTVSCLTVNFFFYIKTKPLNGYNEELSKKHTLNRSDPGFCLHEKKSKKNH